LNADGRLWIDQLGKGRADTGHTIAPHDAERIIYLVATLIGQECDHQNPLLSAELPGCGSRFQGILPPIVQNPIFSIRKKAVMVFTLSDYVSQGILTAEQAAFLSEQVKARANILIAGGTGSGKTTLANALLEEMAACQDRIVIIEDTRELQRSKPPCACALIASSLARCAGKKPWICSKLGTRAIPVG
jgi:Flp pilus assembly CpaF family ATPase